MVDKKEYSPAEIEALGKKGFKRKLKEEKKAVKADFKKAIKEGSLESFEGFTPTEYDNMVNNITTGTTWQNLNNLSKKRDELIYGQADEIAQIKNTILENKALKGSAELIDIQQLVNYYVTNITESIRNGKIDRDIELMTEQRMRTYGNTSDVLNKKVPFTRMSSGWKYKNNYNIAKDQSVSKVLGNIMLSNIDDLELEDFLTGAQKGEIDISRYISKYKPNRQVMGRLVEATHKNNIVANLIMNVVNDINSFEGIKGANNIPVGTVIDDALDRVLVKVLAGSSNAPDSIVKEGIMEIVNGARDFVDGLEGQYNSKSIIEHQQRLFSAQFSDIIDDAHKEILSLPDVQNQNLVRAIITDRYGFPTEEPILNKSNTVNKKYYGTSYENIIKGDYWKSEEMSAIIADFDDRIERARGSNRLFSASRDLPELIRDKQKYLLPEERDEVMKFVRTNKNVTSRQRLALEISNAGNPRINEMRNMTIGDLLDNIDNNEFYIRKGKKGANRMSMFVGPMGDLQRALKIYLETHPDPTNRDAALFPSPSDVTTPVSLSTMNKDFVAIKEATGVNVKSHMFRHTNATELLGKSGSPAVVMEQLGHRGMAEVSTYAHTFDETDLVNTDRFVLDKDGIVVDIRTGDKSLEETLTEIRDIYVEKRAAMLEAGQDFKVNKDAVRVHRLGSNIFEYSVHPNIDINIKNIEIDTDQADPTKSIKQVKRKIDDPFLSTKKSKNVTPTPIATQVLTAERNTRDILNNITFHAFVPNQTDDSAAYLANPDNVGFIPESKKYQPMIFNTTGVDSLSDTLNSPYRSVQQVVEDTTLITNPVIDFSNIELPKDVTPRDKTGKLRRKNKRKLTSQERKSLWKNSRRLTVGALLMNAIYDIGYGGKAAVAKTFPFFSKRGMRDAAELSTDVAVEWGLYDEAQWGNFILRNEYTSEGGIVSNNMENIHADLTIGSILDMPQAQSTKELYQQLDSMSADDVFSFLTEFDVESQIGTPTDESRFDVAQKINQEIGPFAPLPNNPEARDKYFKNKAALQKGFLARDYTNAQQNYLNDLEKRVFGIDEEQEKVIEKYEGNLEKGEWNFSEGFNANKLKWKENMAKNQEETAVTDKRKEKITSDKEKLARIKELYADQSGATEDLQAVKDITAQINKLDLNFINQPKGENDAVNG